MDFGLPELYFLNKIKSFYLLKAAFPVEFCFLEQS